MKLTILFIFAFLTMAFCASEAPTLRPQPPQDHRDIDNLRYFFLTIFKQVGLSEPENLVGCFNDDTATIFFKSLFEFHQILIDTNERNELRLHLDYLKFKILLKGLEEVHACIAETDDWEELLKALGIDETDPKKLAISKYIYYQARYEELLDDFTPVVENLETEDNRAAGIAYYKLLKNMVSNIKKSGLWLLGNEAFGNGIALRLGLNDPTDSVECWNNNSSEPFLRFLNNIAEAVVNGSWYESPVNARCYWDNEGRKLWNQIPDKVFDCLAKSDDNQQMIGKIGLDIYDEDFIDLLLRYINNSRLNFFISMKGLKHSFDNYNLNHAGFVFGHLIQRIAKTNDDLVDELQDLYK